MYIRSTGKDWGRGEEEGTAVVVVLACVLLITQTTVHKLVRYDSLVTRGCLT